MTDFWSPLYRLVEQRRTEQGLRKAELSLPPLDGRRIAVGLLPNVLARQLARLEPYGMLILIGLYIVLPMFGSQLGVNLRFVSYLVSSITNVVTELFSS